MKLNKAIEILNHRPIKLVTASDHAFFESINLGIQAIKRVQSSREFHLPAAEVLLLGETEEK